MKIKFNARRFTLFTTGMVLTAAGALAQETPTIGFDRPATHFTRSLPIGNGRLGAMVFGGTDVERIVLNVSGVRSGKYQPGFWLRPRSPSHGRLSQPAITSGMKTRTSGWPSTFTCCWCVSVRLHERPVVSGG